MGTNDKRINFDEGKETVTKEQVVELLNQLFDESLGTNNDEFITRWRLSFMMEVFKRLNKLNK
jgi:hypothetical protein